VKLITFDKGIFNTYDLLLMQKFYNNEANTDHHKCKLVNEMALPSDYQFDELLCYKTIDLNESQPYLKPEPILKCVIRCGDTKKM